MDGALSVLRTKDGMYEVNGFANDEVVDVVHRTRDGAVAHAASLLKVDSASVVVRQEAVQPKPDAVRAAMREERLAHFRSKPRTTAKPHG